MPKADKWLTIRVTAELEDTIHREAQALRLKDSAYVRMLIELGRDRAFLQHVVNELHSEEVREALWFILAAAAETRQLERDRYLSGGKDKELHTLQNIIALGVDKWKTRLRVPTR